MSSIQRIGYYFLYNEGTKIERDKKQKPLKSKIKGRRTQDKRSCQEATKKGFTMKKNAGYSINFAENTITLTKAFAQRAKNPASAEFRELAKLHKNLPDFTITMRTAVITADKEKHNGLTIKWMTDYIKNYKDEVAVAEFEEVKKFYKSLPGYYGKVKGWFLNKYPNYQDIDFADVATSTKTENNDLRIAG